VKSDGSAVRRPAQGGREHAAGSVRIAVLPPAERLSLRAPAESIPALSAALRVDLPVTPKSSFTANGRTALWLGPDEWTIIDQTGSDPLADCAGVGVLHSAVGISHRNVAFSISGAGAEDALSAGCPQDLSLKAFPVGACSRTILGKVEIVLLRTGDDTFRVECWRSFSDYVLAFLAEAAADTGA
jgi:sarcosine oxidase subunit gamma